MKKTFTEPKLKRIELNLKENIATSTGDSLTLTMGVFRLQDTNLGCQVIKSGLTGDEVQADQAANGGMVSPGVYSTIWNCRVENTSATQGMTASFMVPAN